MCIERRARRWAQGVCSFPYNQQERATGIDLEGGLHVKS